MVFPWFSHGFPMVFPLKSTKASESEASVQLVALHAREDACGAWEATRGMSCFGVNHGKTMGKQWKNLLKDVENPWFIHDLMKKTFANVVFFFNGFSKSMLVVAGVDCHTDGSTIKSWLCRSPELVGHFTFVCIVYHLFHWSLSRNLRGKQQATK